MVLIHCPQDAPKWDRKTNTTSSEIVHTITATQCAKPLSRARSQMHTDSWQHLSSTSEVGSGAEWAMSHQWWWRLPFAS